ncbi:hypothetical protein EVG20_g6065 [Dentipellis fragilis]|uniref:NADH-ubiquinone oxidoreductase 51kDa subunit FMN-binding domain-containing protein n=1 Tax=Dentipellis fragilis TaxID=205917 RepID=A0A4Y9YQN0_9AGAM|nr:hypothetical protein EVG20_g6065 [Dentipellis fragilis]
MAHVLDPVVKTGTGLHMGLAAMTRMPVPSGHVHPSLVDRQTFATVQDIPTRRYGGLQDEDRVFTNAYCWYDHLSGLKWSFMKTLAGRKTRGTFHHGHLLLRGELGTLKDCKIPRGDLHKLVEGYLVAGRGMNVTAAYIYIRSEFVQEAAHLQQAIDEAHKLAFLGETTCGSGYAFEVYVHRGTGAHICGEETALIESLEGKRGKLRLKPPSPPMSVSSVTLTLSPTSRPSLSPRRSSAAAPAGSPANPYVVQEEMANLLRKLVKKHWQRARRLGQSPRHHLGRCFTSILPIGQCSEVLIDYESLKDAQSSLGTGTVIVMEVDRYCRCHCPLL